MAVSFAIIVLLEIAAKFLLFSGPLHLPNMVKAMLPFQARGENQHMVMTLASRKRSSCGSLVASLKCWRKTVTPPLRNLVVTHQKKRSPRIGQQDVSSCFLVSFSKNAALISNCSRPRDYQARGAVSPCASYTVCGWERVFVESC